MTQNAVLFEDELCLVVNIRDISDIKKLEDYTRISKFKSVILASTSHELRNPLSCIISTLNSMEDGLPDALQHSFKIARISSNLMLFLLNDILDYS